MPVKIHGNRKEHVYSMLHTLPRFVVIHPFVLGRVCSVCILVLTFLFAALCFLSAIAYPHKEPQGFTTMEVAHLYFIKEGECFIAVLAG